MVGDDYVQSHPLCPLNLTESSNPAINTDNQTDALSIKVLQGSRLQSIAFGQAVWNIGDGLATEDG